jgi:hypothetical protein
MSKLLTPEEELKLCAGDAHRVPMLIRVVYALTEHPEWFSPHEAVEFNEWIAKRHSQLEERDV